MENNLTIFWGIKLPQRSLTSRLIDALKENSKLILVETFESNSRINYWLVLRKSIKYRKEPLNLNILSNYEWFENSDNFYKSNKLFFENLYLLEDCTKQSLSNNQPNLWIVNSSNFGFYSKKRFCMNCACLRKDKIEGYLCSKCKNPPKMRVCSNCSSQYLTGRGILCKNCKP